MAEIIKADLGLGMNVNAAEFIPQTKKREEDCPREDMSCSIKQHDGCCVPSMGMVTLVQQWNINEPLDSFTMHGLWPGDCISGTGPIDGCPNSPKYNTILPSVLSDPTLAHAMNAYWPDSTGLLWTNQWNKHGTCLSTVEWRCFGNDDSPNDAIRYFRLALDVYFRYHIMAELQYGGIEPNATYHKDQILDALSNWGDSLALYCRGATLYEVRIFLRGLTNNQFGLRGFATPGTCPGMIRFPAKPSNDIDPIQYYGYLYRHVEL